MKSRLGFENAAHDTVGLEFVECRTGALHHRIIGGVAVGHVQTVEASSSVRTRSSWLQSNWACLHRLVASSSVKGTRSTCCLISLLKLSSHCAETASF